MQIYESTHALLVNWFAEYFSHDFSSRVDSPEGCFQSVMRKTPRLPRRFRRVRHVRRKKEKEKEIFASEIMALGISDAMEGPEIL